MQTDKAATDNDADAAVQDDLPIDGGDPTAAEAEELRALEAEQAPAKDAAPSADEPPATGPKPDAATKADAAAPAAAPPETAAPPAPAPRGAPATADPRPEAPRDFDTAATALLAKYNDGDLDEAAYQAQLRALNKEEAAHMAHLAVWEDRQTRAKIDQDTAFQTAAFAWQAAHQDFIANPLHVKSMNDALELIAAQHPEFGAVQLIDEAARVTFDAYHYAPPTPQDAASKIAAATAARRPKAEVVPPSLHDAPAAANMDPGRSSYKELDDLGISELEDAVARMSQEQLETFLADAPGAASHGT